MTKVLVTGATGLLGRETVNQLADAGNEVHAIVRNQSQEFRPDVHFHEVDLTQPLNEKILPEVEAIYHLSQAREFRDFPDKAPGVFSINTSSTLRLLDFGYRTGIQHFVFASTGGVYDPLSAQPLQESSPVLAAEKLGFYAATKFSSEALAHSYSSQFSIVTLRYFFIYGPDQARGMLIPRIYDSVKSGSPITLTGEQGIAINPVYVEDAARATIAAGQLNDSITINIAGPGKITLREIAEQFGEALNVKPQFSISDGRPQDLIADISRMSSLLIAPSRSLGDVVNQLG